VLTENTVKLPRKAEYIQTGMDASGRTFEIRIYTVKSEEIFTLVPKLTREIAKAIDELKRSRALKLPVNPKLEFSALKSLHQTVPSAHNLQKLPVFKLGVRYHEAFSEKRLP
jgi:hypothetical protein